METRTKQSKSTKMDLATYLQSAKSSFTKSQLEALRAK